MGKRHTCGSFETFLRYGERRCRYCGRRQFNITGEWQPEITMERFVESWLPAVSGTDPKTLMHVQVAFPFEFRCYESWGLAFKVTFRFDNVSDRVQAGLGTPVDVMNGWSSTWSGHWNSIDHQARSYFRMRTGREFMAGDNTYAEMRAVIQS
jgi:hypothetical protein